MTALFSSFLIVSLPIWLIKNKLRFVSISVVVVSKYWACSLFSQLSYFLTPLCQHTKFFRGVGTEDFQKFFSHLGYFLTPFVGTHEKISRGKNGGFSGYFSARFFYWSLVYSHYAKGADPGVGAKGANVPNNWWGARIGFRPPNFKLLKFRPPPLKIVRTVACKKIWITGRKISDAGQGGTSKSEFCI